MKPDWFERLGDVPGVDYAPLVQVDRRRLPGVNDRPQVHGRGADRYLAWPFRDGTTSQSPASEHAGRQERGNESVDDVLRHLAEVLELPGAPGDYHFAIQHALEALWNGRRGHPEVFEILEQLAWLNIRLARARPDAVSHEREGDVEFYWMRAFPLLATLSEREGAWREALDVMNQWAELGPVPPKRDELAAKVAALDAEGA